MTRLGRVSLILLAAFLLQGAALNRPAPGFALKNTQGQTRKLSGYEGQVVLINFWASWCAPCQIELPELNRLARDYKGKKVRIIAVNVDQDPKAGKAVLRKLNLLPSPIEILWDSTSKVVSTYNIESMPSSFILDPQGIIRFTHTGFHSQDPAAWRAEINSLLR